MVRGDEYVKVFGGEASEEVFDGRVSEPGERDASVGRLASRQFPHHFGFCACVAEDVDEVDDQDVQRMCRHGREASEDFVHGTRVVHFVVGEGLAAAIARQLLTNQFLFVEVFALVFLLIDPEVWIHLLDLERHQSGEDGIAGILRGSGKDAVVEVLFDVEVIREFCGEHAPLVKAAVVQDEEQHFPSGTEAREDTEG